MLRQWTIATVASTPSNKANHNQRHKIFSAKPHNLLRGGVCAWAMHILFSLFVVIVGAIYSFISCSFVGVICLFVSVIHSPLFTSLHCSSCHTAQKFCTGGGSPTYGTSISTKMAGRVLIFTLRQHVLTSGSGVLLRVRASGVHMLPHVPTCVLRHTNCKSAGDSLRLFVKLMVAPGVMESKSISRTLN